jgi:hypothetical protein
VTSLTSTIADEYQQTHDLKGYQGQLDRFIKHLAPFGINLERDVPLDEQKLPSSHVLLTPTAPPTDLPLGIDTRTYQPPPSPRRPKKKAARKGRSTLPTEQPSPKPHQRRRRREPDPSDNDEDALGDSGEEESPIPPGKRQKMLQSKA